MQCSPHQRRGFALDRFPAGEGRRDPSRAGAAGKRAAEEGRTPEAVVMHPTHRCCRRESRGFPPFFVGTVRQSVRH